MKNTFFTIAALSLLFTAPLAAQLGTAPAGFATYHGSELPLSMYYPGNWTVDEDDGNLVVATSPMLLDRLSGETPQVGPGDTVMVIGVMPAFFLDMMGVPTGDVAVTGEMLFQQMIEQDGSIANTTHNVVNVQGRRVSTTTFDDASGQVAGMLLVVHEQQEAVMFCLAYGRRRTLENQQTVLTQIASSLEFTGDFASMFQ